MGDGRTAGVQALQLGLLEPDAMAEHGALAAQAMVIVDVEIACAVGEQLLDPGDLGLGSPRYASASGSRRCSRHSAPAGASCSGELDPAKRGVMA